MDLLKRYYMTVYSVAYSVCGKYLVAGNSYGKIVIFNLSSFLEFEDESQPDEAQRYPFFSFAAHSSPIYSLVSTKKLIISGSVGEITAWKWNDIKKKENKMSGHLQIPQGESLTKPEVNALVLSSKDSEDVLYAGCGDNNIYCIDIEKMSIKFILKGHTDFVSCLAAENNGQECISGSEDGSVRLWDPRKSGKEVHMLEPYKHEKSSRPQFGKWIGCVAFDENDDWIVCGGAPVLCIWHLKSLSPATPLHKPNATSNVAYFFEDTVISGGSEPFINHWSLDGKLITEVPTSASNIFDIGINSSPTQQVLSASGSGSKIDVCTDFRFKDFTLIFL